jgi:hypothetical protein
MRSRSLISTRPAKGVRRKSVLLGHLSTPGARHKALASRILAAYIRQWMVRESAGPDGEELKNT